MKGVLWKEVKWRVGILTCERNVKRDVLFAIVMNGKLYSMYLADSM